MKVDHRLQIKFKTSHTVVNEFGLGEYEGYVCFRHAVLLILQGKDEGIEPEIDEYGDEYDCRITDCYECEKEKEGMRKKK